MPNTDEAVSVRSASGWAIRGTRLRLEGTKYEQISSLRRRWGRCSFVRHCVGRPGCQRPEQLARQRIGRRTPRGLLQRVRGRRGIAGSREQDSDPRQRARHQFLFLIIGQGLLIVDQMAQGRGGERGLAQTSEPERELFTQRWPIRDGRLEVPLTVMRPVERGPEPVLVVPAPPR